MNCHGNHNEHNEKDHKVGKHMIIMVLCCLIPVFIFVLLLLLKIESTNIKSILLFGVFLLCPILHGLMMFGMMRHSKKNKE